MRHVAPRLAELTAHAQALTSSGDLAGARAVLVDALAPTDADPLRASPDLAEAAGLLARILVTLGDPQAARDWAGFAHTAQRRLYGPEDQRTLAATATHAAVLHRVGNHALAAQLYRDVVEQLTDTDGPDSLRVLAAHADLATAEHSAGECIDAQARLADAWQRHRRLYGDAAPAGIKMLARLGAMERDCGQLVESREHLALAGEFCARYLPGNHVLARQIAALASAPMSGRHRCDPVTGTGHGFPPDQPSATGPRPGRPAEAVTAVIPAVTDTVRTAPGGTAGPGGTAWPAPGVTPLPRTGTEFPLPPVHTGQAASARGPFPRASPPRQLGAPAPNGPDDRRLPVPVHYAEPAPARRPLVIAAVAGAGVLAAVAAAVVLTLPGDDPDPAAAPTPAASVPRTAGASGAAATSAAASATAAATRTAPAAATAAATGPGSVSLRDGRDSVTLEWVYPAGAEGPVLISGGRTGQERRAFQELPAGSVNYVVYGLNDRSDYCFTVAVVYSADTVAEAAPVCTARG
jgi:hypothetical protein